MAIQGTRALCIPDCKKGAIEVGHLLSELRFDLNLTAFRDVTNDFTRPNPIVKFDGMFRVRIRQ